MSVYIFVFESDSPCAFLQRMQSEKYLQCFRKIQMWCSSMKTKDSHGSVVNIWTFYTFVSVLSKTWGTFNFAAMQMSILVSVPPPPPPPPLLLLLLSLLIISLFPSSSMLSSSSSSHSLFLCTLTHHPCPLSLPNVLLLVFEIRAPGDSRLQ